MKLHRFYVEPGEIELKHDFWLHDERLLNQWTKVLRFRADQQVVLFDGAQLERLYKINEITEQEAHLQLVTDFVRKTPREEIYLFWSLLKKDKNDWVLQKCTELGVSHFVPILADRSEKTGFNLERANKIVIEAAEQCGRSDIPSIREPIDIQTVFDEFRERLTLYICEQSASPETDNWQKVSGKSGGILIGPEGGWSDQEKDLFQSQNLQHLNLHDFTLRAETACVAAVTKLIS